MSRFVPIPKIGVYGTNLPRELALFENSVIAKFRADDDAEFGPLRYVGPFSSVCNARPWDVVAVSPPTSGLSVVLPKPFDPGAIGAWIGVKNDSDSNATITVVPLTGTIDGAVSFTINSARRFQWFYSTGAEWKAGPSSATNTDLEIRANLAADQNNYSPTGWSAARYVFLNVTATTVITGLDANVSQLRKTIIHVGTEEVTLGFYEESSLSTTINRIRTPTPNDIYMLKNWSQDIYYDRTDQRWRFV